MYNISMSPVIANLSEFISPIFVTHFPILDHLYVKFVWIFEPSEKENFFFMFSVLFCFCIFLFCFVFVVDQNHFDYFNKHAKLGHISKM